MGKVTTFQSSRRLESGPTHMAGLSLLALSGAAAAGLFVELLYGDDQWPALLVSTLCMSLLGGAMWRGTRLPANGGGTVGAIRAVGVSWVAIAVASGIPFLLAGVLRWDLALFEGVSGLTGTGSTVLAPIEGNTHGILFYRQMIQWVGGMGVVVLAVAVLPFLGIGGLELFRAESPGPTSDQLVPRVSETARRLWSIYCSLTGIAIVVLLACGMNLYDAVSHAATGLGTGGFSPYNDSISHFDSAVVEGGVIFAMMMGSVKFPLIYAVYKRREIGLFWRNSEFRFFIGLLVAAISFITLVNTLDGMAFWTALRGAAFNVVSLMSTCGFGTDDFTLWVPAAQLVLLFLMVTGSMAGSTSGAVKLFRVHVVAKHAWREIRRVRRPRAVFPIRLGREPIPEDIVNSVLGYVMFYFVTATVSIMTMSLLGSDLATASGAVVTSMGGVGPGLGLAGPASNFLVFDGFQRLLLMFLMLLGRLEIFPLILFLVPLSGAMRRSSKRTSSRARRRFDERADEREADRARVDR